MGGGGLCQPGLNLDSVVIHTQPTSHTEEREKERDSLSLSGPVTWDSPLALRLHLPLDYLAGIS